MKLTKVLACGLLSLTFTSASNAAAFYDNFNSYTPNTELHGVGGWSVDAANLPTVGVLPGGLGSSVELVSGSGDVWGTLGGRFSFPNTKNVELSHSAAVPLFGTAFQVDVDIVASTGGAPNRDIFGWSLKDGGGSDLIRFAFEPGAPGLMEVVWYDAANVRTSTGHDIAYNSIYTLKASFSSVSGSDLTFNAAIVGINTVPFSGLLAGAAGANIATVNADFDVTSALAGGAGNNYMAFNGLEVPEPSSMLTAGLALLGMTFRRRR
jgi:hypothetical protein